MQQMKRYFEYGNRKSFLIHSTKIQGAARIRVRDAAGNGCIDLPVEQMRELASWLNDAADELEQLNQVRA